MSKFSVLTPPQDPNAPKPDNGATILMHYEAEVIETGLILESSFRGEPRRIVLGVEKLPKGLFNSIMFM